MKSWNKINWPALNRRTSKIEVDLRQWWSEQGDLKEKGATAPVTQADCTTAQALMVWGDDGGSVA